MEIQLQWPKAPYSFYSTNPKSVLSTNLRWNLLHLLRGEYSPLKIHPRAPLLLTNHTTHHTGILLTTWNPRRLAWDCLDFANPIRITPHICQILIGHLTFPFINRLQNINFDLMPMAATRPVFLSLCFLVSILLQPTSKHFNYISLNCQARLGWILLMSKQTSCLALRSKRILLHS